MGHVMKVMTDGRLNFSISIYVPYSDVIVSMYVSNVYPFLGADQNTQADVFKDTKHLMLSVIDGYNVCIFAYGNNKIRE